MRRTRMTLEDHLRLADTFAITAILLDKIYKTCVNPNTKNRKLIKAISNVAPMNAFFNQWLNVISLLDNEYQPLVDNEQFAEHGHIYYNLEARGKAILADTERLNTVLFANEFDLP